MQKELECPCTKADCERHGDCVACYENHTSKPDSKPTFCMRPENIVSKELEERVGACLRAAGIQLGGK